MSNEETNTPLTGDEPETGLELSSTTNEAVMALASATSELARALTAINYTPTDWVDLTEPDIDAAHLNKIEQGILQATTAINSAFTAINAINSNLQYKELTSGFDLNNALGRYRSGITSIVKSLVNAPPELANAYEIIVEWYQAQSNNAYGIQLIYCRLGISGSADSRQYIRSRNADKWNAWEQVTLKSDLRNIIYSGGVTSTEFDHRQDSGYYILGMYDVINPKTGVTFDIDYTNGQLRLYRIENGVGTFVGRVTLQK